MTLFFNDIFNMIDEIVLYRDSIIALLCVGVVIMLMYPFIAFIVDVFKKITIK